MPERCLFGHIKKNPTASFVINDLNSGIMNIYKAIKGDVSNFTEELDRLSEEYLVLPKGETNKALEKSLEKDWVKLFQKNPCRRYFYYRLRDQHAFEYETWTKTKEAAVLYFLMKTGFNGVWQENKNTNNRFGTPSGLLNQKTEVYDIENVLKWSRALKTTHIMTGDFPRDALRGWRGFLRIFRSSLSRLIHPVRNRL